MKTTTLHDLSVLQSDLLLAAGVPHGWFDTSLGNVVFRADNPFIDPEWIDRPAMKLRQQKACAALGLDGLRLVVATGLLQTDIIQILSAADADKEAGPADGYLTNAVGLPIILAAADCIQTIVYASDANAMAVVHAGGLGTARGVLSKAAKRLIGEFKADPKHMIVAIGPSVGPEHFVPTLAADNFTLADIAETRPVTKKLPDGRTGYDIAATNVRQLRELCIPESQIEVSTIDTFTDPRWYSFERDKETNRAVAMRRHGLMVALPVR